MAARKSYASDRRQSGGYSSARSKAGQAYMYGNVVAKPEYEPKKNRSSVKRRKKVSRQVQKNRNRALHMNAAYVVFLADGYRSTGYRDSSSTIPGIYR